MFSFPTLTWDYGSWCVCGGKYFSFLGWAKYFVRRWYPIQAPFGVRGDAEAERPLLFFRNKRPTFRAKESIWLLAYAIEIRVGRTVDHFHSGTKVSSMPVSLLLSFQSIFDIDVDQTRIHACTRRCIYTLLRCLLLHEHRKMIP